MKTIAQHCTK